MPLSESDVQRLREEHHMTGILLGTLPQLSQQNVFLGLPLQLLPEEVHLLMKYGLSMLDILSVLTAA
jgi:tRNA-splicing endonuclease subunit Sen34